MFHSAMAEKVSLVVVGAGVSGLAAALAWLRHAEGRVVVVERYRRPGGFVTSFARGGYLFDTCQMFPDLRDLLDALGVDIPLKRYEHLRIIDDEGSTRLPLDRGAFQELLRDRFPRERRTVDRFFDSAGRIYETLTSTRVNPGFLGILSMAARSPATVRAARQTFREYAGGFGFRDPRLLGLLELFCDFGGLPADRVSALAAVGAMFSLLQGAWRPAAPFSELPRAMARAVRAAGGEIRLNTEVEYVTAAYGRARGVRLAGGGEIEADNVVTTTDTRVAMERLVGIGTLWRTDRRFAERVRKLEMSPSTLVAHLGLDERFDLRGAGLDGTYTVLAASPGRGTPRIGVTSPSLATGLRPALTLGVYPAEMGEWAKLRAAAPDEYSRRKQEGADALIEAVERALLPGLSAAVRVVNVATPATFARYTGSPGGSIYDMAAVPGNYGLRRLPIRTPLPGLYHPKLSHGILGAMLGGMQAADIILDGKVMGGRARPGG